MAATRADSINYSMECIISQDNNYCYGGAKCRRTKRAYKEKAWKENKGMGKETKSGIRTGLLFKEEESAEKMFKNLFTSLTLSSISCQSAE